MRLQRRTQNECSIMVANRNRNNQLRPLNLNLAKPYAVKAPIYRDNTVDDPAMKILLANPRQMLIFDTMFI
ncbi:hypothetical protein D3C74_442160 [compost metagenome]